jgi:transposase
MSITLTQTAADLRKRAVAHQFMQGEIRLPKAMQLLGKSRATVYRYAKRLQDGVPIIDGRRSGNHRKRGFFKR